MSSRERGRERGLGVLVVGEQCAGVPEARQQRGHGQTRGQGLQILDDRTSGWRRPLRDAASARSAAVKLRLA